MALKTVTNRSVFSISPIVFIALLIIVLGLAATLFFVLPYQTRAALLTQELEMGMENADVTSLQDFLSTNKTIYPEAISSGYFGTLTEAAVSRYQLGNGISVVGRVGPITLANMNAQMGSGASIVLMSYTNTTTGDVYAPIIYPESVFVSSNTITFNWATSESAVSRVLYGTSWPFLYATAPSVSTNTFGQTTNITLTGLSSKTTYYYVLESRDSSGNVMLKSVQTVVTQ